MVIRKSTPKITKITGANPYSKETLKNNDKSTTFALFPVRLLLRLFLLSSFKEKAKFCFSLVYQNYILSDKNEMKVKE